ncbi:MAG: radical SAM protein [Bacteroidales bacterium]|nr:radical SAM protein [Bacteroidales bacterium]
MVDLQSYMTESIRRIMGNAYRSVLGNPREARFVLRMQQAFHRSERRRRTLTETEGLQVPPFLIASIATACNLQCKGCYARKNGIAAETPTKPTLSPEQWGRIFAEAEKLGVNFCLLAGGEPLTRRDLLEQAAAVKDIIFPVFTNGTMIGATYTEFFRKHLNMVPVISLEGNAADTDTRRGEGIYRRVMTAMDTLHGEKIFFGTSITVTTDNYRRVTSEDYLRELHDKGCRLVFYVEYVPFDESTRHLAFGDQEVAEMEQLVDQARRRFDDIVFLSFPGDEKSLDGCLAAGRGFFHIGPDGSAEPCPFSPYSDTNVARDGLRAALHSPLFTRLRDANTGSWQHTGGCTLYEHRDEVEQMLGLDKGNV